jgi:hypothetical protein
MTVIIDPTYQGETSYITGTYPQCTQNHNMLLSQLIHNHNFSLILSQLIYKSINNKQLAGSNNKQLAGSIHK